MTERKSESESAELVALADKLQSSYDKRQLPTWGDIGDAASAARRLAAQDQKPVALAHVRLEDDGLFAELEVLDGTNLQPSMSPVALYLSPPPAAGWDELLQWLDSEIETASCLQRAAFQNGKDRMGDQYWSGHTTLLCVKQKVEALRHNAPPDSGVGKDQPCKYIGPCGWKSDVPDHGGADAGGGVREAVLRQLESLAEKQKAYFNAKQHKFPSIEDFTDGDGNVSLPDDITPLVHHAEANGRYSEADWWLSTIRAALSHQPAPVAPNASAEACALREKLSAALAGGLHHKSDCAVYLAPAYEPRECDCGAKDASAEARLREALEEAGKGARDIRNELDRTRADRDSWKQQFESASAAASEYSEFWEKHSGEFDQFGNYIPHNQIDGDLRAAKDEIERLKALSTHPHASDCDKQREKSDSLCHCSWGCVEADNCRRKAATKSEGGVDGVGRDGETGYDV